MSVDADFRFDPWTAEYQRDLWQIHRTLRDEHPVYHDPERGLYVLSRFADIWRAVNDVESFSNQVAAAATLAPMILYLDPPRQTALRALVSRAFTPKRVAELEGFVRATVAALIGPFEERGEGDAQGGFASILPSMVIARLIGLPDDQVEEFRHLAEAFIDSDYTEAVDNMYRLFAALLEARRREPADDLMSALIEAEIDGQRLAPDEVLGFCQLLISAGNDTTSSFIGNCLVLLAEHPEQRRLLIEEPSRMPEAIEEMMRMDTPTQMLSRVARRDVELHGVVIPAGSEVQLLWGAANHDEREFADPDRFDITRPISRHLALGHGTHYCLGASLARLETRVALEEWLGHFPDYRLARPPERVVSFWARAHREIRVELR